MQGCFSHPFPPLRLLDCQANEARACIFLPLRDFQRLLIPVSKVCKKFSNGYLAQMLQEESSCIIRGRKYFILHVPLTEMFLRHMLMISPLIPDKPISPPWLRGQDRANMGRSSQRATSIQITRRVNEKFYLPSGLG